MNILLVDDERKALQEIEDAVSVAVPSAQRYSFQSSQEALAFVETTPVDIAFWDIDEMDAFVFSRNFFGVGAD